MTKVRQPGDNLYGFVTSKISINDTTGVITYAEPVSIPYARTLGYDEGAKAATMWGDGKPAFVKRKRGDIEINLEVGALSMEQEAEYFGATKDGVTGFITENLDDVPAYHALGWVEELANGKTRVFWALWGVFQPVGEEYETYQGDVAFKARKMKYVGQPRPIDGKLRIKADENEIPAGKDLDTFFTSATLNDSLPTQA